MRCRNQTLERHCKIHRKQIGRVKLFPACRPSPLLSFVPNLARPFCVLVSALVIQYVHCQRIVRGKNYNHIFMMQPVGDSRLRMVH